MFQLIYQATFSFPKHSLKHPQVLEIMISRLRVHVFRNIWINWRMWWESHHKWSIIGNPTLILLSNLVSILEQPSQFENTRKHFIPTQEKPQRWSQQSKMQKIPPSKFLYSEQVQIPRTKIREQVLPPDQYQLQILEKSVIGS
jgi:hypothetical protein